MAENKKSFILYCDLIHTFKELSDTEAGKLIKHVLSYVNDENPEMEDRLLKLVFEPIKQQLKRDLVRWEDFRVKQSENGKLGGRPKKPTVTEPIHDNPNNPSLFEESQKSLNVTVNVNDNVNEREKENSHPLQKSNLFRKPVIPTIEQVEEKFLFQGGSKEMANKFFNKHNAVGWYANGSPITNFNNFVPGFISNWNRNNGATQSNEPVKIKLK
jgi:hypothetical protein